MRELACESRPAQNSQSRSSTGSGAHFWRHIQAKEFNFSIYLQNRRFLKNLDSLFRDPGGHQPLSFKDKDMPYHKQQPVKVAPQDKATFFSRPFCSQRKWQQRGCVYVPFCLSPRLSRGQLLGPTCDSLYFKEQ